MGKSRIIRYVEITTEGYNHKYSYKKSFKIVTATCKCSRVVSIFTTTNSLINISKLS